MALADIFPLKKFIFVQAALEVTGSSQYFLKTKLHRDLPVLYNFQKEVAGIHKCRKKQVIEILIGFLRYRNLCSLEGGFFFLFKKDACSLRTGKGNGIFPKYFKFFNMPGVFSAGIAQHFFSDFAVNITEILFI